MMGGEKGLRVKDWEEGVNGGSINEVLALSFLPVPAPRKGVITLYDLVTSNFIN
jgi:hypothetical protein